MAKIENGCSHNSLAESQKGVADMTTNAVPASPVMQRLVLIRKLHHEAENLAGQGGLVGALSVLLFHDSVDLFAQLAREVLLPASTSGRNNPSMLENLGELNANLPSTPVNMQRMRNLSTARDALKHGGIIPAEREIERFRVYVADLFDDIAPLVFQTTFSDISMASLITLETARNSLQEALRQADSGDFRGSLSETGKALYLLIHEHKKTLYALSPATRKITSIHSVIGSSKSVMRESVDERLLEFKDLWAPVLMLGSTTLNRGQAAWAISRNQFGGRPRRLTTGKGTGKVSSSCTVQR